MRFLSRGRAFSDAENAQLTATPVLTGADYERGDRPLEKAPVVATAAEAPPQAGGAPSSLPGRAEAVKR
jgi:hypothetical protein